MSLEISSLQLRQALNDAQYQAVTSASRALLVLAGAGSGKTRVITYRVAYLIEQGVPAGRILAVTFTNKAAGEMRQRIERLVGPAAQALWMSTFHSACARLLRRDITHLGRSSDFTIYDTSDSESVIRECLKEMNLSSQEYSPNALRETISYLKNHLLGSDQIAESAEEILGGSSNPFAGVLKRLYPLYEQRLLAANALDFDDLLLYPLKLFKEHPEVLEKYRRRFRYLLVDEYQDTNRAQYEFTRLLGRGTDSVCVVGDDDQSIYRWRGAHPENLERFQKDFAPVEVVYLEDNYRSTASILKGAASVVNAAPRARPKRLWAKRGPGEPVYLLASADEEAEAQAVVSLLEEWNRKKEFAFGQCAVFFRTVAQSRALEEELMLQGIPYTLVGGVRFYERKEVKDVLAYVRAALNPRDEMAWRRIVGLGHWSVGEKTLDAALELARKLGKSLLELSEQELAQTLSSRGLRPWLALSNAIGSWNDALREPSGSLVEWFQRVIAQSHYLEKLAAQKSDRASRRELENTAENLEQLVAAVGEFTEGLVEQLEEDSEPMTFIGQLELFLARSALMSEIDYWKEPGDSPGASQQDPGRVVLMTLHSAKGLEFPAVIIVGCEEELFPHIRSLDDPEALAEERRLCYVGMTRAERRLVLSYAYTRKLYGRSLPRMASRFLRDIPESCIEKLVLKPAYEKLPEQHLRPGDWVSHAVFGPGRVLSTSGSGPGLKVHVAFTAHGEKTLMQSYAKLRKL